MTASTYYLEFVLAAVQLRGQPVDQTEETEVPFIGDQHSQKTEWKGW